MKRYNYISYIRVFAMLSVILGHTAMYGSNIMVQIYKIIYIYHIPLFVFISGWLFWDSKTRKDTKCYNIIINRFLRLVVPAFVVALMVVLPTEIFITKITPGNALEIVRRIGGIFRGEVAHLWFLLMLFWVTLFFTPIVSVMHKNRGKKILMFIDAGVLLALGCLFLKSQILWNTLFYSINQTARYLYYFALGIVVAQGKDFVYHFIVKHKKKLCAICGIVLLNLIDYIVQNYENCVGAWFIIYELESYLIISTLFILIIYIYAIVFDDYKKKISNVIAFLDKYSMEIYFVHITIGEIATKIMQNVGLRLRMTSFNMICFTFLWMVLGSVLVVYIYSKLKERFKNRKKCA